MGWTKLREVVRKALPETELAWLDAAQYLTLRRLENLVARTGYGLPPGQSGPDTPGQVERSQLRLQLVPEVMELLHMVCRMLSGKAGRRLSLPEVLELLCVE